MRIARDTAVILHPRVTDADGAVLDTDPLRYVHGYEDIFAKIQAELEGKQEGDVIQVRLEPADGFGEYDAALVEIATPDQFPKPPQVGQMIERDGVDALYRVIEVTGDKVVLDGNHPLAGLTLIFNATVAEVCEATADEVLAVSGGRLTARVRAGRSLSLGLVNLILAPVAVIGLGTGLASLIDSLFWVVPVMLAALAVMLMALWIGIKRLRDIFRRGDVLRIDRDGLCWQDDLVEWRRIERVKRSEVDPSFTIELSGGAAFELYAGNLSAGPNQIAQALGKFLPPEKLPG